MLPNAWTIIDNSEAKNALDPKCALIIDTLPSGHYESRHIPGAVNACVYEVTFLEQVRELGAEKETSIILYGAGKDSRDSLVAAEKLHREGYENLAIFPGGLQAWAAMGLEMEGIDLVAYLPPHPVLNVEERDYKVVLDESYIKWCGRNYNGSHCGTVALKSGVLAGAPMTAEFSVDMGSIKNTDLEGDELQPVLEAHLKSDDFFFTKMFPEAKFFISEMRHMEDTSATLPNYEIAGSLSLLGKSEPVSFDAHLRSIEEDRLTFMANFDIDRTQWGCIYGSSRFFQHLSYHLVFDLISIEFRIVLE